MLRRRSIRLRILVLVLVPVLALIGLYAVVLDLTLGNYLQLRAGHNIQSEITQPVASLQTQLTFERALAVEYMAIPRHSLLVPFLAQQRRTDHSLRLFEAASSSAAVADGANAPEVRAIAVWRADLATLGSLRSSVVSISTSRINALVAYSNIITDGNNVTTQAILPLVTGTVGIQATDVVGLWKAAQTVAEEGDLIRADLSARSFPAADLQLFSQLVTLHQEIWNQTLPALDPAYQAYFRTLIPAKAATGFAALENELLIDGVPRNKGATLRAWTSTLRAYGGGMQIALLQSGNAIESAAEAQAATIALRLILTGGLGLLAIIAAIIVAVVVSRGLVRQLNDLRLSALEVSGQRLPSVMERLRAGEEVDVSAEAPAPDPGINEIGQVRQAFNAVHQTAIAAAVDESRIRRGVNDVFRNLARRNQSLLTRQLQLLDSMERRIHDPEELADLFKIDHLTTRMRRHAEGLLIVAGGSSGRSWREPVPIVDVMRAAVAEVEDYTRIRVMSRTGAAVAGHAVADVIHLLAELLENATMFSPTNTPVRVDSDMVARGLAVEIEDRGLGMSEEQIAAINRKLIDAPLFDLSGSDQLGLFIAGQLARRHDIKITLRTSAFGGTAAVVLVPRALVILVNEDDDPLTAAGVRELGGRPIPQLLAALPGTDAGNGMSSQALADADRYLPHPLPEPAAEADVAEPPLITAGTSAWMTVGTADQMPLADAGTSPWPTADLGEPTSPASPGLLAEPAPSGEPAPHGTTAAPPWQHEATAGQEEAGNGAAEPVPLIGAWPTSEADAGAWLTGDAAQPAPRSAPGTNPWPSVSLGEPAPITPIGTSAWSSLGGSASSPEPADNSTSGWPALGLSTRPQPATQAGLPTRSPTGPGGSGATDLAHRTVSGFHGEFGDPGDLPVRVRQASLAPQLRGQDRPARTDLDESTTGPSPEAARNTMAALQRGWERGRSLPVASEPAEDTSAAAADGQPDPQAQPEGDSQ
jgi:signal transduction histidine kinase